MDRADVPITYLREQARLLRSEGVGMRDLFRGTGLTAKQLDDPGGLMTNAQQLRFYENALALSPGPGLGLRWGALFDTQHHGVLGYAALCAPTARDRMRMLLRYSPIRGFLMRFEVEEHAGGATLSAHDVMPVGDVHRVLVEELLAMFGGPSGLFTPSEVRLDYAAPPNADAYRALFACPIVFEADDVAFVLSRDYLDSPSPMADVDVARICEERCQALLARLGSGGRTVDLVRSQLVTDRAGFDLEAVARSLGVSASTVRRRLRAEGTSFRAVVADVRKALALDYLESTDLALKEIAALLGYEDEANFNRAFRRWVGESPGRIRKARRGR